MKRSLTSQEAYKFIANHPFIFFIHERQTDLTLFIGRYMKSTALAVHHTELWLCICFEFDTIKRLMWIVFAACSSLQASYMLSHIFLSVSDTSKPLQVAFYVNFKLWHHFLSKCWEAGDAATMNMGCSAVCKFTSWQWCLGNLLQTRVLFITARAWKWTLGRCYTCR